MQHIAQELDKAPNVRHQESKLVRIVLASIFNLLLEHERALDPDFLISFVQDLANDAVGYHPEGDPVLRPDPGQVEVLVLEVGAEDLELVLLDLVHLGHELVKLLVAQDVPVPDQGAASILISLLDIQLTK